MPQLLFAINFHISTFHKSASSDIFQGDHISKPLTNKSSVKQQTFSTVSDVGLMVDHVGRESDLGWDKEYEHDMKENESSVWKERRDGSTLIEM